MINENAFEILKNDHNEFLHVFHKNIKDMVENKTYESAHKILSYCYLFLEKYHHEFEEVYLFKEASKNKKIKHGGPICTYYYDIQMSNKPLLKVYQELGIKKHSIQKEHIPSFFVDEFEYKLPIVIPL